MKEEIKVDAKRLISEVYKRSALWNQKDVLYHNRDVTNRIWMELSTLFGLPRAILKAKWKGLRDTYRAVIKKEHIFHKNKFPRSKSVWIHYKRLQFLKEQMLPRPPIWERKNYDKCLNSRADRETTSSVKNGQSMRLARSRVGNRTVSAKKSSKPNVSIIISNKDVPSDPDDSCIDNIKNKTGKLLRSKTSSCTVSHETSDKLVDNTSTTADITENTSINNSDNIALNEHLPITIKHEPAEEIEDNIKFENDISFRPSIENEMMLQTVSSEQVLMTNPINGPCETQFAVDPLDGNRLDDNYFLMSLLPHIKTLPAERRMLLRIQMQELVYKEVYKKNNS